MKSFLLALLLAFSTSAAEIKAYFSPNGGCTAAITKELAKTKTTILVQASSFTSAPIAKALVEAHQRGVNVQVVLDKSQRTENYSSADFLHSSGIATFSSTPSTPSLTTKS